LKECITDEKQLDGAVLTLANGQRRGQNCGMRFAGSLKESVKQSNLKNVRKNPHFGKDTPLGRQSESAEVA
jgi:hypothetical protein